MKPIPYDANRMMHIELVSDDDGTVYEGEYIDMRINRATIPKGKFAYDCRHNDDGDWVTPVTIEDNTIVVNFAGTFIVNTPIIFNNGENFINVTAEGIF